MTDVQIVSEVDGARGEDGTRSAQAPGQRVPSWRCALCRSDTSAGTVLIERALLERIAKQLRAALTKAGHLAQRVTNEHLGYCGHRSESKLCSEHRQLVDDVERALDTGKDI